MIRKIGLYTLSLRYEREYSSFYFVSVLLGIMKFLVPSVLKLGCKRCIGWKQQVKIFLLSIKMSCLRCFCSVMKFLISSVVKLVCKCCIG